MESIQGTLEKERERHRCALKLLPYFFTKEELKGSNTDGSHGKERLDATKLNSIKVLIFSKFPSDCPVEKEKLWRGIKGKINAKCRASIWRFELAFPFLECKINNYSGTPPYGHFVTMATFLSR